MSTIDQLAPATAASDTDEFMVSQSGIARKVTRAQVVAGLQPVLTVPSGTFLGRKSTGAGAPETLTIGTNLVLNGGTLSATTGYVLSTLPAGTVPAAGDLVAMSQAGTNTAVPFGQFISGLSGVAGLDASQMMVTATGASTGQKLADFASETVRTGGGMMTGTLILAANPTTAMQAAPKQYVDTQTAAALPISGGIMTGPLTLAADPTTALQAATKEYVDAEVSTALPKAGGAMTGTLALAADPVASSQAATKHYVDSQVLTSLPVSGGAMSGALTLAANPTMAMQAAPKQYVDMQAALALPIAGGAMSGALMLAADPTTSLQAATKEYVDTQMGAALPKAGGTMTGMLVLAADPVASSQAATKHYIDGQLLTSLPVAGGTMSGALTLAANPTAPLQAAPKQYVDAQVGTVLSTLPTSPIVGANAGRFTAIALPAGGGLALTGGNLSVAPSGVDFSSGYVTPTDTGTATAIGAAIGARLSRTGDTSASTVVATGTTTARTLAARFSSVVSAKDYGAKGDGVTNDTTAISNWLAALSAIGGTGYVPCGTYLISSALTQTIAGVAVNIRGDGAGSTALVFTGATNGLMLTLTRKSGVWGSVRLSDIAVVRNQTSPLQANTGLSIVADPTAGIQYYGNSGLSDVFVRGPTQASGWATGIVLENPVCFELRNVNVQAPGAAAAGTDIALSIVAPNPTMFAVSVALTDCVLQGFSTGLGVSGYVQGVTVAGSTIIGNWWGINWNGINAGQSYAAASTTAPGNPILVSPGSAAALAPGMVVNGSGIAPQSRIGAIDPSTGQIILSPVTTGTVSTGESILFQTITEGEQLNVVNSTFNAQYRDVLMSWGSLSTITGSTFIRFGSGASNWAAIDLEESNNNLVDGNTILGSFSGIENGIIVSSLGNQGVTPNVITANVISSVTGAGVVLGGTGATLAGGTISNTTVLGNAINGASAVINSNLQNANTMVGNSFNGVPTDFSLNTNTGALTLLSRIISINPSGGVTSIGGSVAFAGAIERQGMMSSSPLSSAIIATAPGVSDYRILGSSTLAALTIELPPGPANGQVIRVSSQVMITVLTVKDGGGGTADVQTPPTTLAAGGAFSAQWNAAASAWWCYIG